MRKTLQESEKDFQNHSGLIVYDPVGHKTVFDYHSDRYFTPASNTKILTLLTCLTILKDSIPAIRYKETNDSILIWGTGDPSLLNPECHTSSNVFDFLKAQRKPLALSFANSQVTFFGPGWAWDDYYDYYSQERSSFPIYGNSFKVYPFPDQTLVVPKYFKRFLCLGARQENVKVTREVNSNQFALYPGTKKTYKEFTVPFKTDPALVITLLSDSLKLPVSYSSQVTAPDAKTIYSIPVDSLYKVMMQKSDNHIAEQLLLVCSSAVSDTISPEIPIRLMQQKYFSTWPHKVVWKDGSGLSRYNQVTPLTILTAWQKIYDIVPSTRLFPLLAIGGQPGTLKNYFKSEKPYVFGKTGTISNNFSLSGFLVTKKGKTLVFAFMNANYVSPVGEIRKNVERILNLYYEHY